MNQDREPCQTTGCSSMQNKTMLFHCGAKSMQGRRNNQEDRHVIITDFGELLRSAGAPHSPPVELNPEFSPALCLGLFDGHMGAQASTFCAKQLPIEMAKELQPLLCGPAVIENSSAPSPEHIQQGHEETSLSVPETQLEGLLTNDPQDTDTSHESHALGLDAQKKRKKHLESSTFVSNVKRTVLMEEKIPTSEVLEPQEASKSLPEAPSHTGAQDGSNEGEGSACIDFTLFHQAMVKAFLQTDQLFFEKYRLNKDGSTVSLVLVFGHHVFVCWLGDSRVLLASERSLTFDSNVQDITVGNTTHTKTPSSDYISSCTPLGVAKWVASALTCDHKPSRADEQKRIIQAGGHVFYSNGIPRVVRGDYHAECRRRKEINFMYFGAAPLRQAPVALAVSRSMGDREFKFGLQNPLITAVPEIRYFRLLPALDKAILLGCDGIWDVLQDQEVVTLFNDHVQDTNPLSCEEGASAIVKTAYQQGSQDNLTLVYLFLA